MPIINFKRFSASRILGFFTAIVAIVVQDDSPPTIEEIEARLSALEGSEVEDKDSLAEIYSQSIASLRQAADARGLAAADAAMAADAPKLLESIRAALATPPQEPDLAASTAMLQEEVEESLKKAQAELESARTEAEQLDGDAANREDRKEALPAEITDAEQSLNKTKEALDGLETDSEEDPRRLLLLCQMDEYRAVLLKLQAERDLYEAERELLTLQRDRASRRVVQAEKTVVFWEKSLGRSRTEEGEAAALEAKNRLQDITRRFPRLQKDAEEISKLAATRAGKEGLPQRITRAQIGKDKTRALLDETKRRMRSAQRKIAAGGLTDGMGGILQHDLEWLPNKRQLGDDSEAREKKLSAAQLELIAIEEVRIPEGDLSTSLEQFLARLQVKNPSEEFKDAARKVLAWRREEQRSVLDELGTLTSIYYEQKDLSNQLLASVHSYRSFIEESILWVRSYPRNPIGSLRALPTHGVALVQSFWDSSALAGLPSAILERPISCFFIVALLVAAVASRRFVKRKRQKMGSLVRSYRTDQYIYTVRALVQTLLLALPLPLLTWTLGWLLSASTDEISRSVGFGMRETAKAWLILRFLRGILVDKGVGQAHFKWPQSSLVAARKALRWFTPLALGLSFIVLTLHRHNEMGWSHSIGRLCFVAEMVVVAVFSHRLLRAESDLWIISPTKNAGLMGKTHRVWSLIATGLPVALALLAIFGYYYTALQFENRLRYSIGFALSLVLVNALLLRWLFMTRRRLAVDQALSARARKDEELAEAGATESGSVALDVDKIDIPSVDAQTRELFKSSITLATILGLYFIWASVLPALQGLDRVQILPKLAIVPVESSVAIEDANDHAKPLEDAAGTSEPSRPMMPGMPSTKVSEKASGSGLPTILTLADVLLALVFLLLTIVAAKNLPALLELALLQRLPLDNGARFAISSIVRYLVLLIGIGAISGALGIGWQQIQWLAAALTFGLAFGLQEIFANFVSGLIILIERPIRVGDIVTVAGIEGRVTRLRMRATTIQDWDRRELLIPNKDFITGTVTNWTLTDPITRIVIQVGIAYGSDTAKARNLLMETAQANSLVLEDPRPQAIFRSFGESTLDLELRVFIANRDYFPKVVDGIHTAIDEAFRSAGIEIAFPQRDVHLHQVEENKG